MTDQMSAGLLEGCRRLWRSWSQRFDSKWMMLRAMLFGYAFFAASMLHEYLERESSEGLSKLDMLFFPLLPGLLLAWLYPSGLRLCRRCFSRPAPAQKTDERRGSFLRCTGLLFLAWLPVFLAYYPGLFAYDAHTQIHQFLTGEFTLQHPLLHTWLLGIFYRLGGWLGSYNAGLALHTLLQMILFAAAIAYMLLFLRTLGWPRRLLNALLLFFALMPFISVLAISMTKDVLFAAAFLGLFVHIGWGLADDRLLRSRPYQILFLILGALVLLLRNNGVYALLVLLVAGGGYSAFVQAVPQNGVAHSGGNGVGRRL